jgi:CheY-like chemotaxis protein
MSLASTPQPVVMLDDSKDDLVIAQACFAMSGLLNPFIPLQRPADLFSLLVEVKSGSRAMPVALLLDLNMPFLSGFEVLAKLRADETFKDRLPVIVLTNSDNPKDRERAIVLGANQFKTKDSDVGAYAAFFRALIPPSPASPKSL